MAKSITQVRFPWRIFGRVVLIQSTILLVALGASGLTARYFFKRQFISQVERQLRDALTTLSGVIPDKITDHWCKQRAANTEYRLTIISYEGHVLCDSHHEAGNMENHRKRPEIIAAQEQGGFGNSIRHSSTIDQDMFYGALTIPGRKLVLRAAIPLEVLSLTMHVFDVYLGIFLGLLAIVLGIFAVWSARQLVFPIGRLLVKTQNVLTPGTRLLPGEDSLSDPFGEWSDLESNIDKIRRNLEARTESLSREQVELETIMGAISDAILAVDPDGNPLFFNTRFELLFGTAGLRKRNLKLWEIFREPEILNAFESALKDEKLQEVRTISLGQGEGLKRFFSLSVSPLRKPKGHIYAVVGIFHDVTDLKSAEQMRIDFVANVTHELRTPLTSIKGYTDTLVQDAQAGRNVSQDYLSIIARNTDRLMNLMNDLLDLSSLESIDVLQREQISTQDITERIAKQMQGAFKAKNQTLEMKFSATSVYADPNRLEQVLVNLLDNANKYTPSGGKLSITWMSEGKEVLLKISDTGPGVPLEHQARLFERFYRVDKARSRAQGGTGLGLAIVKHIMQRHEGGVWIESKPGQGATFLCKFPNGGTPLSNSSAEIE